MTDTNPTPENLAATLVEVSQQLEDLRGSTLDPTDPLNEVVSDGWTVQDPNKYEERDAFDTLQRWGAPRTLRNILKAYATNSNSPFVSYENYTIDSPTTEASYRVHRLEACRVKSPDGREQNNALLTKTAELVESVQGARARLTGSSSLRRETKLLADAKGRNEVATERLLGGSQPAEAELNSLMFEEQARQLMGRSE